MQCLYFLVKLLDLGKCDSSYGESCNLKCGMNNAVEKFVTVAGCLLMIMMLKNFHNR